MPSESPEQWAERRADELLPHKTSDFLCGHPVTSGHCDECPAHYRPAVAAELDRLKQERDDLAEQVEQARAERDEAVGHINNLVAHLEVMCQVSGRGDVPAQRLIEVCDKAHSQADDWLAALDEEASDG